MCVCALMALLHGRGQGFPVAITELMPDPTPSRGLPPEEFVELWNTGNDTLDLGGWMLTNGRSRAKFPAGSTLFPNGVLLLCKTAVADSFVRYGRVLGLAGFPALRNDADTIWLEDARGRVVHAAGYSLGTYGRSAPGGRSIEAADPRNTCRLANQWQSSNDDAGGNPGTVKAGTALGVPGVSMYAFAEEPQTVMLVFNERVSRPPIVSIEPAVAVDSIRATGILGNRWLVHLASPLAPGVLYGITANGISVCDSLLGSLQTNCMLPDNDYEGLVLNEILFDPPAAGADYIELFNGGPYAISLSSLRLGNRDNRGSPAALKTLATDGRCLLPGEFCALSTDTGWVRRQFGGTGRLMAVPALPAFPDKAGAVLLLQADGRVIDAVDYEAGWHHPLVRNPEGVALERLDAAAPGNDRSNWSSAAAHARYGTPGLPNSQAGTGEAGRFFSTEMGSRQVVLHYRFPERGYVLSVTVYDSDGHRVRTVIRSGICGLNGTIIWDGRGDTGHALPAGPYVLVAQAFHPGGKTLRARRAVGINW